ncbi:putative ABC-type transporter, periplasmic component [Methylophaga frappieri]|uniref:Putative ABC-type transporter, periplasmic component n=1 Tax=Methylophaga frappieri (strain ATCC BAA-2434 / DSM 25690 / JAM7) TaxID=754477 RepID=I1YF70_METFJ|nr:ABC transporter substrate-binding protein [Methylophaga frappieri]AFJ01563.1 putative ABC-type transporter, periplasmic component [Methylophaga frappieri]
MRLSKAILLSVMPLWFSLSAHSADYPLTITDDRGKQVTFNAQPESIASISAFGADLLAALGKQATGMSTLNHQQSAFLGDTINDMVDLGEIHETNMELLTELNPDLTIGIRTYTEPFEKKFEEIGKFLAFDLVTYADSVESVEAVSAALGEADKGKQLNAEFADSLKAHQAKAPGRPSVVFLWHWADVPYGFYNHHLTMEIVSALQAHNAIGDSPQPDVQPLDSAPVSMETLLQLDPDIIVSFKGDAGPIQNHPVWHRLSAVKNGRAYRVGDQYVMPHGPIARDMILRELAYLFYPDHFPEPADIPAAARATAMTFTEN